MHSPPRCVALHLPEWAVANTAFLLSLVRALSAAVAANTFSGECVFVATLGADRSAAALAPAVDALRQVFGSVIAIAEGQLDFPLSDLWRMGDHHMATRIAQRVAESLAHFVAVTHNYVGGGNFGGGRLSKFEQEVLRTRSEDRGADRAGVWVADLATSAVLPAGAHHVACPAPEYPGAKMLNDVALEFHHVHWRMRMAAVCFQEAAAREPDNPQTWQWLGQSLLSEERFADAAHAYGRAHAARPDTSMLINQGVALQRMGDNGGAVKAYAESIEREPSWPEAFLNMAFALQVS